MSSLTSLLVDFKSDSGLPEPQFILGQINCKFTESSCRMTFDTSILFALWEQHSFLTWQSTVIPLSLHNTSYNGGCFSYEQPGYEATQAPVSCRKQTCIHTYIHACIHAYLHTACIHTYIHAYIHTYILHAYMRTYIHTYIHACIHAYIHTYLHTCMDTCIHTYIPTNCMHTCIHAHISTYIHLYIHTHSTWHIIST